jgi:hypothetical protein
VLVCQAVEASGEYDPSEPSDVRVRNLERAVEQFRALFHRDPASICPPDYRWDETLEADAERLGVRIVQGLGEQAGRFPRARRLFHQMRWPDPSGKRFYMPARIAFEPRGGQDPRSPVGAVRAHAAARAAWSRGQPAVISTHRVNYAHLDPAWSEAGLSALRDLDGASSSAMAPPSSPTPRCTRCGSAAGPRARSAAEGSWSAAMDPAGSPCACRSALRGADARVREGATRDVQVRVEDGHAAAALERGEYLLEWQR